VSYFAISGSNIPFANGPRSDSKWYAKGECGATRVATLTHSRDDAKAALATSFTSCTTEQKRIADDLAAQEDKIRNPGGWDQFVINFKEFMNKIPGVHWDTGVDSQIQAADDAAKRATTASQSRCSAAQTSLQQQIARLAAQLQAVPE
jgi:hypothetical protein